MYAYSKKYDAQEVWLLYPLNSEVKPQNFVLLRFDFIVKNWNEILDFAPILVLYNFISLKIEVLFLLF